MKKIIYIILFYFLSFCVYAQNNAYNKNSDTVRQNFYKEVSSIFSRYGKWSCKSDEVLFVKFEIECGDVKNVVFYKFRNKVLEDSAVVETKFYTPEIINYFKAENRKDGKSKYEAIVPHTTIEISDTAIGKKGFIGEDVISTLMFGLNYLTKNKENIIVLDAIICYRMPPEQ
jgi:hypothetical protein